jgi:hypothetical protein
MNKKVMIALGLGAMLAIACGGGTPAATDPTTTTGATPTTGAAPTTGTTDIAKDTDGDGIMDSVDKCPDKKEDGQAPDVKDGCPKA